MQLLEGWLSGTRPYALLVCLCLLLYVPGLATIPPLDRDEARFAQATRQMLETGDFLRIRFQDEARNNKPAGIYWLQAATVGTLSMPESTAIWPYRLPSLVGATVAALLVFGCGRTLFRNAMDPPAARRLGLIAAVLLASSLGVIAEAHIAKTDAALLAAITLGQAALGLAYVRSRAGQPVRARTAAAFWAAEIVAIMLKGPVGPGLAAITATTLSIADGDVRWLRALRPVAGLIATAVAVAPWLIAIERATMGQFLAGSLGRDFITKLFGAKESHGAPPFSYLLLAFATFWPGSLLLPAALMRGWRWHERPAERFLLAWLVPGWVLLELVPTKLPHYVLPLYPALALLAAAALVEGGRFAPATWARRAEWFGITVWSGVTAALAALLIILPLRFGDGPTVIDAIGAALLVALGIAMLRRRPDTFAATSFIAALSLAFVVPATLGVVPGLDRLWLSRSAAALIAQHPPRPGTPVVAVGYSEPSLVFLRRGDIRFATPGSAAEALGDGGEALVGGRETAGFLQAVAARRLAAEPLGSVRGIDYSNGQHMQLTLYAISPG